MIDKNDWRLRGQEKIIMNTMFYLSKYKGEDHDHCIFCWQKFQKEINENDSVDEGFVSLNGKYWICKNCFFDFKEMFNLTDITDYSCLSNDAK